MAGDAVGFDRHYRLASPQLLARVRQSWAARGLDLDAAWRWAARDLPGAPPAASAADSRPVDLLLLFDQGLIWLASLRAAVGYGLDRDGAAGDLAADQVRSLAAILGRLGQELAGVRLLALAGLGTPSLQVARSLSEDVDTALLMLVSRRAARRFAACRSPAEAGAFWRRHIAGGRAFRTVTEALYRVGLDYGPDGSYARWRQDVLLLLGAAAHTSFPGEAAGGTGQALACLSFASLRVQEFCAYSLVLGRPLHERLAAWAAGAEGPDRQLLLVAGRGAEIIVEQLRSRLAADEPPRLS